MSACTFGHSSQPDWCITFLKKKRKTKFGPTAIRGEIDTVAIAQSNEELCFSRGTIDECLAPSVECGSKLGLEVAQTDELGAGEIPFQYGSPQNKGDLTNFIDDNNALEDRDLVQTMMQGSVNRALHCNILSCHVSVRRAHDLLFLFYKLFRILCCAIGSSSAPKSM